MRACTDVEQLSFLLDEILAQLRVCLLASTAAEVDSYQRRQSRYAGTQRPSPRDMVPRHHRCLKLLYSNDAKGTPARLFRVDHVRRFADAQTRRCHQVRHTLQQLADLGRYKVICSDLVGMLCGLVQGRRANSRCRAVILCRLPDHPLHPRVYSQQSGESVRWCGNSGAIRANARAHQCRATSAILRRINALTAVTHWH